MVTAVEQAEPVPRIEQIGLKLQERIEWLAPVVLAPVPQPTSLEVPERLCDARAVIVAVAVGACGVICVQVDRSEDKPLLYGPPRFEPLCEDSEQVRVIGSGPRDNKLTGAGDYEPQRVAPNKIGPSGAHVLPVAVVGKLPLPQTSKFFYKTC